MIEQTIPTDQADKEKEQIILLKESAGFALFNNGQRFKNLNLKSSRRYPNYIPRMADEIHIFPFFTKKSAKAEEIGNLNSDRIILRGIAMERRTFDADAPLSFNGRQVDGTVFYWHPIAQSEDFIQKGIRYTKYGLGFAKKQGLLDRFVRKKERIN